MSTGISHRQALLLQDMGIDLWIAQDAPDPVAEPVSEQVPGVATGSAAPDWQSLQDEVSNCQRCALSATRTRTVFGVGNPAADIMLIGEAPGAEEDRQGEPFVGRAGKLLDAMLFSIGLDRDKVFICNVLKCRPPHNNDPEAEQIEACASYLDQQIAHVRPRLILALGRFAAHRLLDTDAPVWRMREADNTLPGSDIPLVVTYHPASLLRNPENKARAWQDLCKVRQLVN
jgi:DNA polymerase